MVYFSSPRSNLATQYSELYRHTMIHMKRKKRSVSRKCTWHNNLQLKNYNLSSFSPSMLSAFYTFHFHHFSQFFRFFFPSHLIPFVSRIEHFFFFLKEDNIYFFIVFFWRNSFFLLYVHYMGKTKAYETTYAITFWKIFSFAFVSDVSHLSVQTFESHGVYIFFK